MKSNEVINTNARIQGVAFMFTVACFIQSSSLLTSFIVSISEHDSWFTTILGAAFALLFILILCQIRKLFPGKNLIAINDEVFGKFLGKIVSVLYLWFLLSLASLNVRDMGSFVQTTMMPTTPLILILVIFMSLCSWAVKSGLEPITRFSALFTLLSFTILTLAFFMSINIMKPDNFLPMFKMPPIKYVQSAHIASTIPLSEVVIFMMIFPSVKADDKQFKKYFVGGFLLGVVNLLVIIIRDTAVLGNTISLYSTPGFETLRLINLGTAISRVEVMFAIGLMTLLFFKICVLFYMFVVAIAQIFHIKNYKSLVWATGFFILFYSFFLYPSAPAHMAMATNVTPFVWTIFEFILPLLILIGGIIKNKSKTKKQNYNSEEEDNKVSSSPKESEA